MNDISGCMRIGLLGATSLVGECLMPLLGAGGRQVIAFSRRRVERGGDGVLWCELKGSSGLHPLMPKALRGAGSPSPLTPEGERGLDGGITHWVCLAPIWVLPEYFIMLETYGVRRVVVLSSTSRFTKTDSSDRGEHGTAAKLAEGEERLRLWAERIGIEWVILRPTLIYGRGKDKNISEIARFIRRFGFFPLLGRAMGLRQPVHAEDVAAACVAALISPAAANRAYNLSGGETLPYREMVARVFLTLNYRARLLTVALGVFRFALVCLRLLPRYRHWSAAMAERMNANLVFDHKEASRDLNFAPRPFHLTAKELPQ